MSEHQRNWAGNLTYSAARLHAPETVAQVQELVRPQHKLRGSARATSSIASRTRLRI